MTDLGEYYEFRSRLTERLRLELLGPVGGDEEVLTDPPVTAYSTGVLFPYRTDADSRSEQAGELDVDLSTAALGVDEQPDTGVALANVQAPSSMGMTFAVDPVAAPAVTVSIGGAVYEPVDGSGNRVEAMRAERRALKGRDVRWRRVALAIESVSIDVTRGGDFTRPLVPGLELRVRVRVPVDRAVAVTLTLVNQHEISQHDLRDAHCFFQTSLEVTAPDRAPVFVERPAPQPVVDDEQLVSKLLYRHAPAFATGHGCAVDWDWSVPTPAANARRATRAAATAVRTEFVPRADVLLTESNPAVDVSGLKMSDLGIRSLGETAGVLRRLLDDYERWIVDRVQDGEWLRHTEYGKVAIEQVELCREALVRMRDGVDLLERDPEAFEAFRLANRAMAVQRSRTAWIKNGRVGRPVDDGRWRPFQIGFLLLCLHGIADPEHLDRGVADVLWFPTGGGKTEAYLGLIAFTTFLRRLRLRERGGGVTVIMRYTLRLLTLQQFERAATLLCAMETFRREAAGSNGLRLGSEPMSIGMWVGRAATPNTFKAAAVSIDKLRSGDDLQQENPVQLRACPWCGTSMDEYDYNVDATRSRMDVKCRDRECAFHDGLPVHVVDEAVYDNRPTLIIATADKFAQVAWRENVASLFNRAGAVRGTPPPDLIVQDELHLVSGPLGTLAGLYECAVDLAADRPKIIASTATIRRAREQGRALFDRDVVQFPPAGLDARDSWFSVEAAAEGKATRMYLGLMAPGTSQATLLVRTYAALLHHAATLAGTDEVRDPYWTLIGYFNSLRLLAAAELQVQDDVHQALELLGGRDGVGPRRPDATTELTSRVKSSDIPRRLKDLERRLKNDPFDVVLATNMISVGVDVDRLGLMAVTGQPQMTAEYIQATSRIGRQHPGLAVVMYNASRSRDRSHYEGFAAYHASLYRQVESTSVTPFSSRARDRALHAAFVGAARLLIPAARTNTAAAGVGGFIQELVKLRDGIVLRVDRIAPEEAAATREQIDVFIRDWSDLADENPDLVYEARQRTQWKPEPRPWNAALLRSHSDDDLESAWPTLWSLRDVDVEADLYLEN
jgi:Helicase conserved C-terminal domain